MVWNDYFYYDVTSPTCLRWKVDRYGGHNHGTISRKADSVAGNFHHKPDGTPISTCVKLHGRTYKVHRIIWEMIESKIPKGMVVDHLDGNPYNNRIENLQCKTSSGNSTNRKLRSDNKSGKTGVTLHCKGRYTYWVATFMTMSGKIRNKTFNVDRLGNDVAFRLACEHRDMMILELNQSGEHNYTDRHGK